MSFLKSSVWGLTVEAGKEYSQEVESTFCITSAALTAALPNNGSRSSLILKLGNKEFTLCSLTPGKTEQQPLDLQFMEGDEITFRVKGNCSIDLTGNYLVFYAEGDEDDEDESDSEADELAAMMEGSDDSEGEEWEDASNDEDDMESEELDITALLNGKAKRKLPTIPAASENSKKAKIIEIEEAVSAKPTKAELKKEKEAKAKAAAETPVSAKAAAKAVPTKESPAKTPAKTEKAETPASNRKTLAGGLIVEDVTAGTGTKAKPGKKVSVRYIGRLTNGKVFDSNTKGSPFNFRLGGGEVIRGWDQGIAGMSVGGSRKLTIPPSLAYGPRGAPPDIPPNATLEFEVKLLEVRNK
ncbi:hypothetical protein DFS34DRAFT_441195 [Phlyctochytrium arcticum]|nr:hypothetical protein DFS34DRAFT_441195 [Phlyctochytrium arcticum]